MLDQIEHLVRRYSRVGILVDSNILLLYVVGLYDGELVSTFKRTRSRGFNFEDFGILQRLFTLFNQVVTTPNILTEVSGFLNQLPRGVREDCFLRFGKQIEVLNEHYLPSQALGVQERFSKLGLTDMSIMDLARHPYLVLSDDFRLTQILGSQGVDAINFNHLRPLRS